MRSALPPLTAWLAVVTFACSTSSPSTAGTDASAPPAEDASTVPCTSLGGTCVTYSTPCPVLQQNATLCGDSVLLCCLPPDDAGPIIEPTGDSGPADSGTVEMDAAPEAAGD